MKVLVISGFLGAGKTTFIKTMAKRTGLEFAILENEYGSMGIDGDILRNETLPEKDKYLGNGRRMYLLFDERGFCIYGADDCQHRRARLSCD